MSGWLARLLGVQDDLHVSLRWIREQDHREARIEYHGAPIRWPIDKEANEQTEPEALNG